MMGRASMTNHLNIPTPEINCIMKIYITNNVREPPSVGFAWRYVKDQPFNSLKSYIFEHFPELRNRNINFYYKDSQLTPRSSYPLQPPSLAPSLPPSDDFYLSALSDVDIEYMVEKSNFGQFSTPEIYAVPDNPTFQPDTKEEPHY